MNIKYENGLFEVKDNGTEYIGDGVNWQEKKMSDKGFLMAQVIRNEYSSELETKTGKKVRNVFFLCSGLNGKDIYIFMGNNRSLLGILEIDPITETRRWV